MNLNPQQQAVVDAVDGVWVVIAGPGSGKTKSLIERYLGMLIRGIPQRDILNLTFTNAAATEMVKRVGLLNAEQVFRTFHSYALELLKRERQYVPFKMTDTIIPVRGEDYQLLFDLTDSYRVIKDSGGFRALQGKLSEWKRSNVEPEQAIRDSIGRDYYFACAYADYEQRCREQGWLDFDSLMREAVKLLETRDDVRERNRVKYISVDEAQDTDVVQFKFLQLLFGGNILVVGDENQCQPPGTLVSTLVSPACGITKAKTEQVPIEKLSETKDRLVSWNRQGKRICLGVGRKFKRVVRQYDGQLVEIISDGRVTKVTPNHFMWVKFNRRALREKTHFVYLMWRRDLGFRVGTSTLRMSSDANQISHRGYQESADKMWILDIVSSGKEARILEEIYSLKHQIPEHIFQDSDAYRVFNAVRFKGGGFWLLKEKGLLFEHPLVEWGGQKHLTKFHGYFKTTASNLLEELMDLPTWRTYESKPIDHIRKEEYSGPVYSLEVEKDHTYIADDIPVGNCIYEWRNAQPGNLSNFERMFPGARKLYLGRNYRSTGKLVSFFKEIIPVDNGIASHMVTSNQEGIHPVLIQYPDIDTEVRQVLNEAVKDPENSVILARTNRQLFDVQRIAVAKNIKYKNLGKKDFFDQNEVKALLNLAKDVPQHTSAAQALQDIIRDHNLYNRYQNTGDSLNSSPIENLNNMVKLAATKQKNVREFLDYIRKLTYGRKSKKERDLMLSTVHQFKGREAKHVFIIGASQGMMPHKDGELTEERRIWYVACSRAAETLQISWSGNRSMFIPEQYISKIVEYRHDEN